MKIKCRPEDFRVDEVTEVECSGGPFALYRLTKQSLGTPEAIDAICRRWNLQRSQVGYGGLKDRHALTTQHLTIARGPRRNLTQTNLQLDYLGQTPRAFESQHIAANRFEIVVRRVDPRQVEELGPLLERLGVSGLPNYFDEQRFGSVGVSGEFVARAWCKGDYERALWLALAEDNRHDRPQDRREKARLREHWGNWPQAKAALEKSHRRSIVTFLADHPHDFRRALALVRVDLRRLYVSAFQSHLWNQLLARYLARHVPAELLLPPLRIGPGEVILYRELPEPLRDALRRCHLPLPAARQKPDEAEHAELLSEVLQPYELQLRELRLKYPRDTFFSKGSRAAVYFAHGLQWQDAADELYANRRALTLRFALDRGNYATMLIKWLQQLGRADEDAPEAEEL